MFRQTTEHVAPPGLVNSAEAAMDIIIIIIINNA